MSSSVAPPKTNKKDGTRRQIRGSSLLLVGRFLSKGVNFAVQVLTVRYLAKEDYGFYAYAVAMVALASTVNAMALDKAMARFAAIYHERGDYPRIFGALALVIGIIAVLGAVLWIAASSLQPRAKSRDGG